ncbi:MAG TPA: DUF5916 domain-containing protein [Ferruginibacter sp.]|nr:DUF5916 domain-containing protein [Ferruginibacter sp.]
MTNKPFWCCVLGLLCTLSAWADNTPKRSLPAKRIHSSIKIDGMLDETAWKDAPVADKFIAMRPTPFQPENPANATNIYLLYNNEGIYVGGYLKEANRDSIASELIGRDGFGNNDFVGVIFDTYQDKLNGFEYFITPLGEQMDAKASPNNEDFSWNAVWESAAKIHSDGWSFEIFLPYSAIRFGNKKIQDWGLNIVRRRQKSGEQLFWQQIDPNINGFLTQEGSFTGLENIKPPLRLQFSPYLSTYYNHDGDTKKNTTNFNGGMDVKYGINQAFTLDMTLIPDFGQVQTDNKFLNLSPFEQQFSENRPFFTEGVELFTKGNLFYSRRIGMDPNYRKYPQAGNNEHLQDDPSQAKIMNATKVSGRTKHGLGIGVLNAITQRQNTTFVNDSTGGKRVEESMPLTNYNILVFDQTMKHNSSVSLINTNVWRSGKDYDANVTSALFDLNDKKNTWNIGGNVSMSKLIASDKTTSGYAHSLYFGKTSGRFLFSVSQDLFNDKYDKSDMGYFTNNNTMDNYVWMQYNWTKPRHWYNQMRINFNGWYTRLVSPLDQFKGRDRMFQSAGMNINANAQTKKLQWVGFNINHNFDYNDFYEPRMTGRVFHNKGSVGMGVWYESNYAKKYSWSINLFGGTGGVFKRTSYDLSVSTKARFSNKFSIDYSLSLSSAKNQPGWAGFDSSGTHILFSRRSVNSVENLIFVKYNFTNRMGLTCRVRHSWTKVDPQEIYELNEEGDLVKPGFNFTDNVKQNFNFLSTDLVYSWQFAQGSFFSVVWKDVAGSFTREFEKSYFSNLGNTVGGIHSNSLSLKVIYFIDYVNAKHKLGKHKHA